jgi:hypothetical protein
MAKAAKMNQKATAWSVKLSEKGWRAAISRMSKVPSAKNIARIAKSMSTLPARVYRKNLMAAYSRRSPPQMPIKKYMGTSPISQNT